MSAVVLLVAISVYGLICTLMLLHARFRGRAESEASVVRSALQDEHISAEKRATLAIEYSKARAESAPWYEKSVSTIGVAGFISMIVATGIQTGDASAKRREVDELKTTVEKLEVQRSNIEHTLGNLSAGAMEYYERTLQLDASTTELLNVRRSILISKPQMSLAERGELLRIAMVLRRVEDAATQVTRAPDLLKDMNTVDANAIAEYLIWMGNVDGARSILSSTEERVSTLPAGNRATWFALRAFVNPPEREAQVGNVSVALKISRDEASSWMTQRINDIVSKGRDFKEAALCPR